MNFLILMLIVSSPVLTLTVWQIIRDLHGKRRNWEGNCYRCGEACHPAVKVHHSKGNRFLYCGQCAWRQRCYSLISTVVMMVSVGFILIGMNRPPFHAEASNGMLIGAVALFALAGALAIAHLRESRRRRFTCRDNTR
ncbi:hypothetical protein [Chitinolyticbacter albus]|uniref:hypothetical protein n=1 Tax=Chitinolyticbacter albus TaxID=2961951 RepID=UPI00210EE06B|nr:hypothetical protein [Chitinolyticbacter albus]